jgi:Phage tail protein RIFT-related domain
VLTEVKAFSAWRSAPTLPLVDGGRAETDLIQIRNIEGLNPVKASVSTTPFGAVDGAAYTGSNVLTRNIVLTIRPNPDWNQWSYEGLRRLLYEYFMPKRQVKLVFYSDDMDPVQIYGYVEDVNVNIFSKDPELIVSIICPDPYFIAVNPTIFTGQTVHSRVGGTHLSIDYKGTVETGINVKLVDNPGQIAPSYIGIQLGDPDATYWGINATVNSSMFLEMSSVIMKKYVQNVNLTTGVITNLLSKIIEEGSQWPTLQPGINEFSVYTDEGNHNWTLTYFERFGGL